MCLLVICAIKTDCHNSMLKKCWYKIAFGVHPCTSEFKRLEWVKMITVRDTKTGLLVEVAMDDVDWALINTFVCVFH